jgi:hypothetical protein
MLLTDELADFQARRVYFCPPIRNNVISNASFHRILYSTDALVLNGICVAARMMYHVANRRFKVYRCSFDAHSEASLALQALERSVLALLAPPGKTPRYRISEQLQLGTVKLHPETALRKLLTRDPGKWQVGCRSFVMKIAGAWETEHEYGLTFKFLFHF